MTTILKAQQELERRDPLAGPPTAAWNDEKRGGRWGLVGLLLIIVAGVTLGVTVMIRGRSTSPAAPPQMNSAATRPRVMRPEPPAQQAPVPQARPAAPSTSFGGVDLPQARVDKSLPAPPPRAAPLVPPMARAVPPPAAAVPRDVPAHETAGDSSPVPGLQVQAISYSQVVGQSTVTLQTAAARAVTLHEGESADGVEVQLIRPDTVYLRRGGDVFAVNIAASIP